jgi:flagellin
MISLQTNVTSLMAQENLRVNTDSENKAITELTSGYRINSSGDDAAGLAVANGLRSNVSELQQGVLNATDGTSTLQILDGGLNNISQILDRMKTLATESASGTFTGDRDTLNNEYQTLLGEITRQASNIGLAAGGDLNTNMGVYIGGGNTQANAQVHIDLSGSQNQVDAAGLGVSATSVSGSDGVVNLSTSADLRSGTYLSGDSTQKFTFDLAGGNQAVVTLNGGSAGLSGDQVVSQLNSALASYGITASEDATSGQLSFSSSNAFVAEMAAVSGGGTAIGAATVQPNTDTYNFAGGLITGISASGGPQVLTLTGPDGNATISLANSDSAATVLAKLQAGAAGTGVSVLTDSLGNVYLQSSGSFTLSRGGDTATGGLATLAASTSATVAAPVAGGDVTANALNAISAIDNAISVLGLVQGRVGAGENELNYATSLAQSQISNFSAAESGIRDADVAAEAADLTKAQVLQQASIAALAQANAEPQALLKLLQ